MKWVGDMFGKEIVLIVRNSLKPVEAQGTYSLCQDGLHAIYIDFDRRPLEMIEAELKSIQRRGFSDFYIFESSKDQYHAVCLDKVRIKEYIDILAWTNCCANFRKGYEYNNMGAFVLRITGKYENESIKYIKKIGSPYNHRIKSNAHRMHLNTWFGLKIPATDENYDSFTKIITCKYNTYIKP